MESACITQEKKYTCPFEGCSATYRKNCLFEIHIRKHTNERPFHCDVSDCQKSYTNVWHLKRHKSMVHNQADEVKCDIKGCGLILSNKYSLKKHKNRAHNDSAFAFNCGICSQGFHRKRQLRQHIFLHNGETPFKCTICDIGYNKLHLYHKHMRNHKTYSCDCGETFNKWTIFCEHRRNSCGADKAEHKCGICHKVFTTGTNLTQHSQKVHVKESQNTSYHCAYMNCQRSYKYKKNLNAHIASFHEKSKDISVKCTKPGCQAILKSERNLRRHLLSVHNAVPKVKMPRNPRKDKGKPKKSMASVLTGIKLTTSENSRLINENKDVSSKPSKDKLKSKQSMASFLTGVKLSTRENSRLINEKIDVSSSSQNNIEISEDSSDLEEEEITQSGSSCGEETDGSHQDTSDNLETGELEKEESITQSGLSREEENAGSHQVTSNNSETDDIILTFCNKVINKIQEQLDQETQVAVQQSSAYCEIQA
ncbi:hypothetical protein JTB14_034702 [Gonioctena quinquepunctata]|nr:hypothetical protein JTB14_034702 [Gonioctena quinquepunctata]